MTGSSGASRGLGSDGDGDGDSDGDGGGRHGAGWWRAVRSRRRGRLLVLLAVLALAVVTAGLLLRGDETASELALAESRLRAASADGALSLDGADVTALYVAPGALPGIALGDSLERATAAGLTRSGRFGEAGCWFLSPESHVDAANRSTVPVPPVDWQAPSVTAWGLADEIVSLQVHSPSGEPVPTWLGVGPGDPVADAAALPGASQQSVLAAPRAAADGGRPDGSAGGLALPVVTVPGAGRGGELEILLVAAGDPAIVPDPDTITTIEVRRPAAQACELPPAPPGMPLVPLPDEPDEDAPGPADPGSRGSGEHEERAVVGPTGTARIPFGTAVSELLASGRWQLYDLGSPAGGQAEDGAGPGADRDGGGRPPERQLLLPAGGDTAAATAAGQVGGVAMVDAVDGAVTGLWLVAGGTSEGFAVGDPVSRLLEVYPGLTATPGPAPGPPSYAGTLGDGRSLEAHPEDLPLDVPGVDVRLPLEDPPVVLLRVSSAADDRATPP